MRQLGLRRLLVAASVLGLACWQASAGVITAVGPASGTGYGAGGVFDFQTPSPNDNNVNSSNNVIGVQKEFWQLGYIDIPIYVTNSCGTTEYFVTDSVVNHTGWTWTDYHLELGFGIGDRFVQSGIDFLDFDAPDRDPTPTSDSFLSLAHGANTIDWWNGVVPSPAFAGFTFSVDVPDASSAIPHWALDGDGYWFTLRQYPTVPEPSSLALLGFGGLGLLLRRRRAAR